LATHKSALKRHRQNQKRRLRNKIIRSQLKTSVKSYVTAIEIKDKAAAQEAAKAAISTISKTASRGVIHKKTASRKISRLARKVNTLSQAG
jgi:small subunit ribosomal protein S20